MYDWGWLTFPFISGHNYFLALQQCLQIFVTTKLCDRWHEFHQVWGGGRYCTFSLRQPKSPFYYCHTPLSLSKVIRKLYLLHLTLYSLSDTIIDSLFLSLFFFNLLHVLSSCLTKEVEEVKNNCLQLLCWDRKWVSFEFYIPVAWERCRDHADFISWIWKYEWWV